MGALTPPFNLFPTFVFMIHTRRTREGNLFFILVSLLLFSSCRTGKVVAPLTFSDATQHRIDSICQQYLEELHYPGLAVAVMQDGKALWTRGYGYADLETKRTVDPETDMFRIGSVSKTITAAALARLYEKHRIDLDAPVSRYDITLPADKDSLTLRQIGGHLAGIRHYLGLEFFSQTHYDHVEEALDVFIHDSLLFVPGTEFGYSTYGWTLISDIMEKATGKSFLQLIHDEVIRPLHLTDLKADLIDSTRIPRVGFYDYRNEMHERSPSVDNSNKWAGGGFLCTADDLARFGSALVTSGYLKPATLTEFTVSQKTSDGKLTQYGIGIRCGKDDHDRSWFGHSGGSIGGTSMLLMYPDQDLVVVTLINLTSAQMNELAWKIAQMVLDQP